ncbi:Peptidase S8/S53 domain [Macleaya cordata]|uniref:Peptidase S8/S53 domain n=1 Tax=Macleaya cordata TaxID=56857 RepID=A0A200QZC0_MACCD|nr:Peptidase S8/S53 domain [Macleaya cordata]
MATLSPLYLWFCLITILLFTSMPVKSDTYIVHMDLLAMPKAFSSHHSWYSATLSSLHEDSLATATTNSPNHIYTYSNVIHGFSASLSPSDLERLKKSPGFVSSIRDLRLTTHTTHTPRFLDLNSISGAWSESSYGKDVIISFVDSGIWPESASFRDDGMTEVPSRWKGKCEHGTAFNSSMCNKKLIGARFFNKGLISNEPHVRIKMNSTRDTNGHGTLISSIAAGSYVEGASYMGYAKGTAKGMAPRAHLAMYKALWYPNSYASDAIAAIEQAIEDGVDVLSLSLGSEWRVPLYEDPIAIATFAAMEKGIFVAASAGNVGPKYGTMQNGIPWVLTVGVGTIDRQFNGIVTLSNGVSVVGLSLYPLKSPLSQVPLIFMNTCDTIQEMTTVGFKIVVCVNTNDRVQLAEQVDHVNNGNVAGGIFITNITDIDFLQILTFPAVFVSPTDGKSILEYIKMSSDPRASAKFQKTNVGRRNPAPGVADYSSRGPSPYCPSILKPDIMAPGTTVLGAYPKSEPVHNTGKRLLFNDFDLLSGTSMSCSHVVGIAALIKGIHPKWSAAAIRSSMMTTADILDNTLNPIKDLGNNYEPANPLIMGAGHVNPNKAIDPGLIYDLEADDYVGLLCSMNFTSKQIQTITRRSSGYNCSNPSSDLNYPSFIAFFNANDLSSDVNVIQEFQRTVTNVGEGMSTYIAKLTAMDGFQVSVKPDKLVFKDKYEKQSYRVSLQQGPKLMKQDVIHGYLSWVEVGGSKHVVTSPIVATILSSAPETD